MYLLDTHVVSELRKVQAGKADPNVSRWADSVDAGELYLSVISVQELEIGVLLVERRDVTQGAMLRTWFNHHVLPTFAGRILPVDITITLSSARLHVPDPHPVRDGLIAATALVHGMTVVTRNVEDFTRTCAKVLNPWVNNHG